MIAFVTSFFSSRRTFSFERHHTNLADLAAIGIEPSHESDLFSVG
jgi:hypothetical protein